ncbi:MarR family winged helix-turn-helix transcriptional regulator [Synechococcus sp. ROS8604]|uniref:MarR family winged helix-turn-helix transcriptional regulator n=1 Tax=Synechococcus sp. ROS8604 TaxID=1442557 RepID=UPI0016452508|nr:hypothetical protein [Synechococcus sp. ROS8604]QNI89392.1 transcriptional regulator/ MarR family [Synechococcus sp. ROS8604]
MTLDKITNVSLYRAHLVIEVLRATGEKEFPMQLAAIFFWVASHNGCRQSDVIEAVKMSKSSVSRCLDWLGPAHRLEHRDGLKLVRREVDPDNYRAYRIFLTPKGEQMVNLMEKQMTMPIKPR